MQIYLRIFVQITKYILSDNKIHLNKLQMHLLKVQLLRIFPIAAFSCNGNTWPLFQMLEQTQFSFKDLWMCIDIKCDSISYNLTLLLYLQPIRISRGPESYSVDLAPCIEIMC